MAESLLDHPYVVLDFETTGLSASRGSEVIETGAVRLVGGEVSDRFHALSRPRLPIPEDALRIHGITNEMVAGEPPFSEVLPAFLAFLGEAVLVAHNAPFDRSFLDAALRHAGRPALPNPVLDTVRLSRSLFPEMGRHDLETLCREHRIERGRRHRALDDVVATATLLRILLERAGESGVRTLSGLLEIGGTPERPPTREPAEPNIRLDAAGQARLEEASITGDRIVISYLSAGGNRTRRAVVPYQFDAAGRSPRLVAYDLEKEATRTFRLDRILTVEEDGPEGGEDEA